jgi:hypothetical protein
MPAEFSPHHATIFTSLYANNCLQALKKLSGVCDQVVSVEGFGVYDERFYMVLQVKQHCSSQAAC